MVYEDNEKCSTERSSLSRNWPNVTQLSLKLRDFYDTIRIVRVHQTIPNHHLNRKRKPPLLNVKFETRIFIKNDFSTV